MTDFIIFFSDIDTGRKGKDDITKVKKSKNLLPEDSAYPQNSIEDPLPTAPPSGQCAEVKVEEEMINVEGVDEAMADILNNIKSAPKRLEPEVINLVSDDEE